MSDTLSDAGSDSSYEVIDYSENPLYCILSAVLQDERGDGVCEHLARLTKAVERNTAAIERYTKVKAESKQ